MVQRDTKPATLRLFGLELSMRRWAALIGWGAVAIVVFATLSPIGAAFDEVQEKRAVENELPLAGRRRGVLPRVRSGAWPSAQAAGAVVRSVATL